MAHVTRAQARKIAREWKDSRGEDEMSASGFIILLTLLIAGGIAGAALVASQTYHMVPQTWWLLPYFGCALVGCGLAFSQNVMLGLIGYTLIILPTGWIVGPYVKLFEMHSVITAAWITVAVTVGLGILGALWHKSVESWGGYLLTALLVLIIVELASIFMVAFGLMKSGTLRELLSITDWAAIAVFCGFVFYDMNQAVRMPRNASNAILAAINMYLNMINLFIRILARTGKLTVEVAPDIVGAAIDA